MKDLIIAATTRYTKEQYIIMLNQSTDVDLVVIKLWLFMM